MHWGLVKGDADAKLQGKLPVQQLRRGRQIDLLVQHLRRGQDIMHRVQRRFESLIFVVKTL